MKKKGTSLLIIAALTVSLFAVYTAPVKAANVSVNLYQGTNCPGTTHTICFGDGKVVNPTLTVNKGDVVNITVHNNDTILHTFTIVTAPYTSVNIINNAGETHSQTFTASTVGNSFTYECTQPTHAGLGMMGTLKVVGGASVTPVAALGVLLTTLTSVYLLRRKR